MFTGKFQSCGIAVLRIVVGVVFLMHGYQKLFKFGFHGVTGMFSHFGIPLPMLFAVVVTLVEFVGGILLITGLATRVPATLLAIDMFVAILTVHLKIGFRETTLKGRYFLLGRAGLLAGALNRRMVAAVR